MRNITLGDGSEEIYQGESSGEAFCKFHLGLVNWASVLRPQCGTLDKRSDGSLQLTVVNQLLSKVINKKWEVMHTKIIESSVCRPALTVPRCTRHNLELIPTGHGNQ